MSFSVKIMTFSMQIKTFHMKINIVCDYENFSRKCDVWGIVVLNVYNWVNITSLGNPKIHIFEKSSHFHEHC